MMPKAARPFGTKILAEIKNRETQNSHCFRNYFVTVPPSQTLWVNHAGKNAHMMFAMSRTPLNGQS